MRRIPHRSILRMAASHLLFGLLIAGHAIARASYALPARTRAFLTSRRPNGRCGIRRIVRRYAAEGTETLPSATDAKKAGFEDAIGIGKKVALQLQNSDTPEVRGVLDALLESEEGARGFFVSFLTSEEKDNVADLNPPVEVLGNALAEAEEKVVGPLLVMNTVMPTAMVTAHKRSNSDSMAEMSTRVARRASILLEHSPRTRPIVEAAFGAAQRDGAGKPSTEGGPDDVEYWLRFYDKWGYDDEMRKEIAAALNNVLVKYA
mmetsp:Transcript_17546/g.34095  ORF Transcript_17546/g.34095 Transcript_17546/m.34095 type:complete len:262 (+) Transcript_17546:1-786(+)